MDLLPAVARGNQIAAAAVTRQGAIASFPVRHAIVS
jgi:sugar/nucleoside kinase (ribokinase family)